jgi:hypothetical protein
MKRDTGIMCARRWPRWSLAVAASGIVGACSTTPSTIEQPAGYWSQVEDVGANAPPRSELDAGPQGTFHPYVQAPGDSWSVGYGGLGAIDGYGGMMPPGSSGAYYVDPFYATNPYLMNVYAPVFYYAPAPARAVTPLPNAKPDPPSSKPPPPPVKSPKPAPPHSVSAPPRTPPVAPRPPPPRSGGKPAKD